MASDLCGLARFVLFLFGFQGPEKFVPVARLTSRATCACSLVELLVGSAQLIGPRLKVPEVGQHSATDSGSRP